MYVIEYVQGGVMQTVITSCPKVAEAMEAFLIALPTVTLIVIWGVL